MVARKGDLRAARHARQATNEAEGISWYGRRKVLFVAVDGRTAISASAGARIARSAPGTTLSGRSSRPSAGARSIPRARPSAPSMGRVNMLIRSDAGTLEAGNVEPDSKVKRGPRRTASEPRTTSCRTSSTSALLFGYTELGRARCTAPMEEQPLPRQQRAVPDLRDHAAAGESVRRIGMSAICAPGSRPSGFFRRRFAPGTDGAPRRPGSGRPRGGR